MNGGVFSAAELGSLFGRESAVGRPSSLMRNGAPMPQTATAVKGPTRAQLRAAAKASTGNKALVTVLSADQKKRLTTASIVGGPARALGIASGAYFRRQVAPPTKAGSFHPVVGRTFQARQGLKEASRAEKMAAMMPVAEAYSGIQPGQAKQALIQLRSEGQRHLEAASASAAKGDGAGVGRALKDAWQAYANLYRTARSVTTKNLEMKGRGGHQPPGLKRQDFERVARGNGAWLFDQGTTSGLNLGDLRSTVRAIGTKLNLGMNRAAEAAMPAAAEIDARAGVSPAAAFGNNGYAGLSGVAQLSALTGFDLVSGLGAFQYGPGNTAQLGPNTPETLAADATAGSGSGSVFNTAAETLANIFKSKSDAEIAKAKADAEAARARVAASGVRPSVAETLTRPGFVLPVLGLTAAAGVAYALFKR